MNPTLIFDYDGTIHNTIYIYEQAFRHAFAWLVEQGYAEDQEISPRQIAGWLGLNSRVMWDTFQPHLAREIKDKASKLVGNVMVEKVASHQAVWYPGAEETLDELKKEGYRMVILSNCKIAYRNAHWKEFHMDRWFDAFYDCESFDFVPKTEIIKALIRRSEISPSGAAGTGRMPESFVVIGDRKNDMECAGAVGCPFIGCSYGFCEDGELDQADALAHSVTEIPALLRRLCGKTSDHKISVSKADKK